jgi:hypothetical protein
MSTLRDTADWTGVQIRSIGVGAAKNNDKFLCHGCHYVNETEFLLAQLLWKIRLPFTPNVRFILDLPPGQRQYVPDFIFNGKAYVWDDGGGPQLIHGIEAKGGTFSRRARQNVKLLLEQRGIHVRLLNRKQIVEHTRQGSLPVRLLLP